MKSSWIFVCLLLLLSVAVYAQEFNIKIDAEKDAYYNTLTGPDDGWVWIPCEAFNDNGPQPDSDEDLSANWYSAWDETYLYVYEEVSDDIVNQNSTTWWQNDCFDAKIDPDIFVESTSEVFCFTMTCMDSADVDPSMYGGIRNLYETAGGGWTTTERPTPEDYARRLTDTGYILECRLKWEWVTTANKGPIYPGVGDTYGFAIMNHDNDSNTRNGSVEWAAAMTDRVWNDCRNHGYIELLADHKIKYVPENLRDPSIVNPNPDMYIPPGTAVSQKSAVVKDFALSQNYPNPFNPTTTISYTLEKPSEVKICVYDLHGREVTMLVNGMKPAGTHTVQFDGSNLSSGIYFYKLQTADRAITRKMMLVK
ncbi:MAG: T9SS type A sorting domain-containing protein [candidate division KSB1 bacterium]|nr:T9SS type A sorting domain-containing protein [candidate division KSB1 bacterium]